MTDDLKAAALAYHRLPSPGKISVIPTTLLSNQRDLTLAYSPGVAAASEAIVENPATAEELTARGNLVAVITNGTAVLGLGPVGPLAAKPVMEGKSVLFKKFAGIDAFDIEVDELDPDRLVDIIASLEPTFGAINLEDIKAPECFVVERALQERMGIPVLHDDQHGTAICVCAAVTNGLKVVGKDLDQVKLVCSGAGAAALACLNLLVAMGLPKEHITVADIDGVLYQGRTKGMDEFKEPFAAETEARTLAEVIVGADIFLGLSAPNVLTGDMVKTMGERPIVLALANPVPEILPEEIKAVRDDAIIATGRSDYPNQVNNVLVFPFIFRGALDVGATAINRPMMLACVTALAELAMAESSDVVARAYGDETGIFGPEYLIPRPFDPRLIVKLAPAVAKAAMDSGVATRPIKDLDAYAQSLSQFVYRTGFVMKPVFDRARYAPKRVTFAEGENPTVLQAAQIILDEGLAKPILIGRRYVVAQRLERLGLRMRMDDEFEIVDPENDPRYREYWELYHRLMERQDVSPAEARTVVRTRTSVIAALMVVREESDALICGTQGRFDSHLKDVQGVAGLQDGVRAASALRLLLTGHGNVFLADTNISVEPSAEDIVETAILSAETVRRFGIEPKIALISHSDFGAREGGSVQRMRRALSLIRERDPSLEVEGEMNADAALDQELRDRIFPNSRLSGQANLLIFPSLDSASAAFSLAKVLAGGIAIGPVVMGLARPAHIVTSAITVRGLVNMTALAVVDAQAHEIKDQKPGGAS